LYPNTVIVVIQSSATSRESGKKVIPSFVCNFGKYEGSVLDKEKRHLNALAYGC
jgi:hypothetical protein